MANTLLALPLDVAWKRIAISADMYAQTLDVFPQSWFSSLAVYAYEPEPDPLDTTGEVTIFLKVVASITGFVWTPFQLFGLALVRPNAVFQIPEYYYPALAALVQVGVVPSGTRENGGAWTDVREFPYFSDFQPKKREVIQAVTETGEQLTRDVPQTTVTKSTTNTPSTETDVSDTSTKYDDKNSSTSGVVTRSFSAGAAITTEVTDASREKRETQSYTTNLSHVYQTLDSYHAGTNRAMFLVSARPDLIDSVYTFVNGPRRLEGIQEFFLVVRRPKEMKGVCVKATLDTAHLDIENPDSMTAFITARAVTGCSIGGSLQIGSSTWVAYERRLLNSVRELLNRAQGTGRAAVGAANAASRFIRDETIGSIVAGARFPERTVHIEQTQFGLRRLIAAIPPTALQDQPELRKAIASMNESLVEPSVEGTLRDIAARTAFLKTIGVNLPVAATARTSSAPLAGAGSRKRSRRSGTAVKNERR